MAAKIQVYYSSATGDLAVKKNQQSLKFLLEKKKVPFEEIDLAQMSKEQRDPLYAKAGNRIIPMVFINDKYAGDYEALQGFEEEERLDPVLAGNF